MVEGAVQLVDEEPTAEVDPTVETLEWKAISPKPPSLLPRISVVSPKDDRLPRSCALGRSGIALEMVNPWTAETVHAHDPGHEADPPRGGAA